MQREVAVCQAWRGAGHPYITTPRTESLLWDVHVLVGLTACEQSVGAVIDSYERSQHHESAVGTPGSLAVLSVWASEVSITKVVGLVG
eukprot:CAMPEP_0202924958 /NCGR_PEP_ID=MMETSP1392-20130828/79249_1 /ASSEMBLY_ACC=CAM_ASM_000868 /TAXON_ID=225041 /ORGANISM="Chlamydomonas chlamydogama, Strain SAG 11-48b" /LENGTH=87 /DNA_ID=CAMNT_0049618717 /DNA_START=212 /DNA_END=475 /DNA_ORIENTATION=-